MWLCKHLAGQHGSSTKYIKPRVIIIIATPMGDDERWSWVPVLMGEARKAELPTVRAEQC